MLNQVLLSVMVLGMVSWALQAAGGEALVMVDQEFSMDQVKVVGEAKVELVKGGELGALRVEVGKGNKEQAGVAFAGPNGGWDLSKYDYVEVDVRNVGGHSARVRCRVDNPGVAEDAKMEFGIHPDAPYVNGDTVFGPGQSGTVRVELRRHKPKWVKVELFNMVCYPWGQSESSDLTSPGAVDAARIANILVYVLNAYEEHVFEITGIRAVGEYVKPAEILKDPQAFFPFIDKYGQYIHEDWPGKIYSDEDLKVSREQEAMDLKAHPGPGDWDEYGGWKDGPTLEATGWFRTVKYNGKWWLVDPAGNLFISMGIDHVAARGASTPIDDRQTWFTELPGRDSEFGEYFRTSRGFPRRYYAGRNPVTFDFGQANLLRKYGKGWEEGYDELIHRRLRSWGLNTIGNWSDGELCEMRKTPYTANVGFRSKVLESVEGWWGKSPDPFDEDFSLKLREAMSRHADTTAKDPWCLGYFVGNEMAWGSNDIDLARLILACPSEQAAKKVFVGDLKGKYGEIGELNKVWGSEYESWEGMLARVQPPEGVGANEDLASFQVKVCEQYFKTVRDVVKETAPNHLYLGCRFAGGGYETPSVIAAAAKYCDVVSFNIYRRTVSHVRLTAEGVDVPMLVGEFSFWGLDRGKFNRGGLRLEAMKDQVERAEAYKHFVRSMLEHPQLVGCHWFQYRDQATTGRGDGENFQFGFVDVADTPYVETIEAARVMGDELYEYRASLR